MTVAERIAAARSAERAGDWDAALTHYESAFASLTVGGTAADAADLFRWIGTVHRVRGDGERAEEAYEASLAIAECARLPFQIASALNCLGILVKFQEIGRASCRDRVSHPMDAVSIISVCKSTTLQPTSK